MTAIAALSLDREATQTSCCTVDKNKTGVECGRQVNPVCCENGISDETYYDWNAKRARSEHCLLNLKKAMEKRKVVFRQLIDSAVFDGEELKLAPNIATLTGTGCASRHKGNTPYRAHG